MKVTINGEIREFESEVTLDRLLELFSFPSQRIAVELNHQVVPKATWADTLIRDSDKIEIVHFVGGG
jgi:thiamine biosynthesis protein ThiS